MGLIDRLRSDSGPRVAFFGIDGVPYSLIDDNPDVFENLSNISDEGNAGPIDSIVPPESSACWPSLFTGVNPGKTGVYGFQERERGSYDTYIPMGRDVQATRVWDYVENEERNATVLNVPVTFPPQHSVQRMVSGFLSPNVEEAAYPSKMYDYLSEIDYRTDVNAKLGHNDDKEEFIEDAHATLDGRFEALSHYVEQDDWGLLFGVFMTTDRVNHFLFEDYEEDGEYKEEFLDFYRKVDDYLGRLREMLSEDVTMVVASDHGFTTLDHEIHLNEWLRQEGWLSYERDDHDSFGDISDDIEAYSLTPGRFYISLEGREPHGSVAEDDYKEKRGELKEALKTLEGPDEGEVCARVVEKEEAYSGTHDDIAPDLVAIPNHGFNFRASFSSHDSVFDTGPRNGMHSFDNACLFVDDENTEVGDGTNLLDITPTLLDLMDIEYNRHEFDGTSLV